MGQFPLYNFFTDMKTEFFCAVCGRENKNEFNLKVVQKGFVIEVVKVKCKECKKYNFVTPVEI